MARRMARRRRRTESGRSAGVWRVSDDGMFLSVKADGLSIVTIHRDSLDGDYAERHAVAAANARLVALAPLLEEYAINIIKSAEGAPFLDHELASLIDGLREDLQRRR